MTQTHHFGSHVFEGYLGVKYRTAVARHHHSSRKDLDLPTRVPYSGLIWQGDSEVERTDSDIARLLCMHFTVVSGWHLGCANILCTRSIPQ